MERYRSEKKPIDVKIAEGGKKLKVVEMGVGGIVTFFNPALGLGIFAFEAAQWLAANKYVDWRMKGRQT